MNTKTVGSLSLASVFLATALVGFDARLAMACSSSGSSGTGLSHGSSLGSGSVTVCVGQGTSSAGSTSTQTISKTVTVKVPVVKAPAAKKAPAPAPKPAAKPAVTPAPKPVVVAPVSCPSASQLASMPRSADAAERWVQSICSPAPIKQVVSKPAPTPTPKPAAKTKTTTISETITIEIPGSSSSRTDAVNFYPNPLIASVFPASVLAVGQTAVFSSNPIAHYGQANVLGRQAQVHFVPRASGWEFSDKSTGDGTENTRSFSRAGKYQAVAYTQYLVSYRLLGETNWQLIEGSLLVWSNTIEISVGAFGLKGDQATQGALLVGKDCKELPAGFGCEL
jgi:hypothetical protein